MKMRLPTAMLSAGFIVAATSAAQAQPPLSGMRLACHKFAEVARQLDEKYNELPINLGMQSNGNVLQVYNSQKTGTWTIVTTTPAGLSCILAAGNNWESMPEPASDPAA